jgi:hypothetical protein
MTRAQNFWLRVRLFVVNAVIFAGAIAIGYFQWGEAVKSSGFGSGGYSQGLVGTAMLWLIMGGIPILIFAIAAHFALTWLFFRAGELEEYKARQVVAEVSQEVESARATKPVAGRRYED